MVIEVDLGGISLFVLWFVDIGLWNRLRTTQCTAGLAQTYFFKVCQRRVPLYHCITLSVWIEWIVCHLQSKDLSPGAAWKMTSEASWQHWLFASYKKIWYFHKTLFSCFTDVHWTPSTDKYPHDKYNFIINTHTHIYWWLYWRNRLLSWCCYLL